MLGNGRKTIGVFVTHVHQEFQDLLCRGICSRAYDLGYNVAIFSNYVGYGKLNYENGEMNMANLPQYEKLDGIIMLPDTMSVEGYKESIVDNIKKYATCPVVSIREEMKPYHNVLIEDDTILEEIIYHFINVHKYSKINILTGPKDNPVSTKRLETYCKILNEHGIAIDEDRIFYGDFWKNAAADAVDKWLSNPGKRPEAIICANDYMAISVCNALAERGIFVPRDMAVSGCDNISISKDFVPPITTVGMPVFDMGMEAVDKISMENQGLSFESNTYLKGITYIRDSCGCKTQDGNHNLLRRRNHLINEVEDKDASVSYNAYMSIDLTGVTMLEDLNNKLYSYTDLNEGYSSFYMCLFRDWDKYNETEKSEMVLSSREVTMEMGIKKGEWLQKAQVSKGDLLPAIYMDKEPQFFFFNILHHQEKCYGYSAIGFSRFEAYKSSYQGWLINVCNALENIKIHGVLNRLVYKLEDMSIKDELTGLYNRRALHTIGQKYLDQSVENQSNLMVFSADMDNLKYINDNYGHGGGDISLKAVARALLNASEDDEICIRMGGDEFAVVGVEYDDKKMEEFVCKFKKTIDEINKSSQYPFDICISIGWSITQASEDTDLEECLSIADSRMYKQKNEKAKRQL